MAAKRLTEEATRVSGIPRRLLLTLQEQYEEDGFDVQQYLLLNSTELDSMPLESSTEALDQIPLQMGALRLKTKGLTENEIKELEQILHLTIGDFEHVQNIWSEYRRQEDNADAAHEDPEFSDLHRMFFDQQAQKARDRLLQAFQSGYAHVPKYSGQHWVLSSGTQEDIIRYKNFRDDFDIRISLGPESMKLLQKGRALSEECATPNPKTSADILNIMMALLDKNYSVAIMENRRDPNRLPEGVEPVRDKDHPDFGKAPPDLRPLPLTMTRE